VPYAVSISPLQYAAAVAGGLLFGTAVFAKRLSAPRSSGAASARSRLSIAGIIIQSTSYFLAAAGPVRVTVPALSQMSLILAAIVLCLGVAGAWLFDRSARALGANWSLVARMRVGHALVCDGPFARVRHPIYLAMLLMLAALGLGFGHIAGLLVAIPVFLVGTAIRVREEERLLRQRFGQAYDDYARITPAFIPRLS
jgi:protein-S-isoprenylcysteine O-methyltransferase Ste14